MRVELLDEAQTDIEGIVAYTFENFGRAQVDDYVDGLFRTFDLLGENPRIGRPLFPPAVFRYVYRMHLVIYEIRSDVIAVARVYHTARAPLRRGDLPPELQG